MSNAATTKSAAKIKLDSFEDLLGNSNIQENLAQQIINILFSGLHTFKDYPFRVSDDKKQKVSLVGVLVSGIARLSIGSGRALLEVDENHKDGVFSERLGDAIWAAGSTGSVLVLSIGHKSGHGVCPGGSVIPPASNLL